MKQLLTIFLISCLISSSAQEAIKFANRSIGGGIAFSATESTIPNRFYTDPISGSGYVLESNRETSSFAFSPTYGRFIYDEHMLGIQMRVATSNAKSSGEDYFHYSQSEISGKSVLLGVFIKRFFPINEKVGVYVQPGANYSSLISTRESLGIDTVLISRNYHIRVQEKTQTISIDMRIGVYYFFVKKFSIETSLGSSAMNMARHKYRNSDLDNNSSKKGSGNSSSINFSLINQFSFDQLFTINYYF